MKRNLTTGTRLSRSKTRLAAQPLLGKLIKWTVRVILAITVTMHIFYISGSYRKVSDDSQLALLRFCLTFSLLLIISSIYGLVLDLYYAVRKRQAAYLAGVLGYLLLIVLGLILSLGAAFVIGAVGGNL